MAIIAPRIARCCPLESAARDAASRARRRSMAVTMTLSVLAILGACIAVFVAA